MQASAAIGIGQQYNPEIALNQESSDILQRLKKIQNSYFFKSDKTLANKLKDVNPVQLTQILQSFFSDMIEEDRIKDPVKFLDRLATVLPFEKMEEAVKHDIKDVLEEAKGMFEEAKLYLQTTEDKTSISLKTRILSVLDTIISVIDSLVTAFGIASFFNAANSDVEADFKSQKIMMLLSIFSMVTTVLLPLLGAATGGAIIGGALLSIFALSIIWSWIKPMPTCLPADAVNWTKKIQNGELVAQGRKESLDEIANILKMDRHPILLGPSRVGKTLTARAFAQAIEKGEYPEFQGYTVFYFKVSDLADQQASFLGGGNRVLYDISKAMGRHSKKIILVLDEIHNACKDDSKIGEKLKTFLDEGGEFPHVIGITTQKDYDEYIRNDVAFSLRFDKVDIENTSREETLKVLAETVLKTRSKPIIDDNALDYIYEKSCENEDAPQPTTSRRLLKQCINMTEKTQLSPTEKKINVVSTRIKSLRSQAAASRGTKKIKNDELSELKNELRDLKEAAIKEKKDIDKLFQDKNLYDRVTKDTYLSILKISKIAQGKLNSKSEKQLKVFLLLHKFVASALKTEIETKANALDVRAVINQDLIGEATANL